MKRHSVLVDERLLVAGGAPRGSLRSTHILDPAAEAWTHVAGVDMSVARWNILFVDDSRGGW